MTDEEMAEEYAKDNCTRWENDCLSVDDIAKENFLAGLKAGRPQWHYVKDGDFPTKITEKEYLVALKSEYGGFFCETDIWCNSLHCFASNNPTKVYAWKEIVLPELKESE